MPRRRTAQTQTQTHGGGPKGNPCPVGAPRPSWWKSTGAAWNCTSGTPSSGRLRKNPPASPTLEVSGPRPSLCSGAAFSGGAAPSSDSASGRKLSGVMWWS